MKKSFKPKPYKPKTNSANDFIRTLFFAFLIAMGFRSVAFQAFNIPSESMVPTLLVGDYLFVSKYAYGYSRYSFPLSLPIFEGRIFANTPERGDVAVFRYPLDNKTDFIKRIIGLPGDQIQMKSGILYINQQPVPREFTPDRDTPHIQLSSQFTFLETLPNQKQYYIQELGDRFPHDNTPPIIVPQGHYFAMGDNRDNSQDSRTGWFVPEQNLIGRAELIFFSLDRDIGAFWQFWKWPASIRFNRIFSDIE